MTIHDRPHTVIPMLDSPYTLIDSCTLPLAVWEHCKALIADVDGSDWEEINVRDTVILEAVEAVTVWKVLNVDVVCSSDDLSCWLCVWVDMPGIKRFDGIHGDLLDNCLVFDLGIETEVPETWLAHSFARAA